MYSELYIKHFTFANLITLFIVNVKIEAKVIHWCRLFFLIYNQKLYCSSNCLIINILDCF